MNSDDIDGIKRILSPTMRRSQLSNGRGAIEIVSDYKSIQECQISILSDETHDSVERLQEYGFTSNPPSGSDAAIIFIGSNRDHGVIIATDSREYRKKNLKAGEVCIYDKNGSEIYLKSDGSISLLSNTKFEIEIGLNKLKLDATGLTVTISGVETKIDSSGITSKSISDETGSMDEIRDVYNSHTHPYVDTPIGASVTSTTGSQM